MFLVGTIVSTFGNKGNVKINPCITPNDFLLKFDSIYVEHYEDKRKFKVLMAKRHKNIYVFSLEGINDMNVAEDLMGSSVYVPSLDVKKLKDNEFFYHDLEGLDVYSETGELVGKVDHIQKGGNDILVIKDEEGKEIMIPFVDELVPEVNLIEKTITINAIEGLVEDSAREI